MRLLELYSLCRDKAAVVLQLQEWGLMPSEPHKKCARCGGSLRLARCGRSLDGFRWQCYGRVPRKCGSRVSVRTGTFLECSKLSTFEVLAFVKLWLLGASLHLIGEELDLRSETLVNWSSFCREVVEWGLVTGDRVLGGEGRVVEVDEAAPAKRRPCASGWVFGALERGSGRAFLAPVESRGATSLLEVVSERVAPGTTVVSRCWRRYGCLGHDGYKRLKVDRKLTFEDPENGAQCGRKKAEIGCDFGKDVFLKGCEERNADPFKEFVNVARRLYDTADDGMERSFLRGLN